MLINKKKTTKIQVNTQTDREKESVLMMHRPNNEQVLKWPNSYDYLLNKIKDVRSLADLGA